MIKVGEIGKQFNYGTFFDLSGNTALSLKFTSPTSVETILTNPDVTAPAVPVTGEFEADTYMQITTDGTLFTEAGTWKVCGTYTDGTPKVFEGDIATFTIIAKC